MDRFQDVQSRAAEVDAEESTSGEVPRFRSRRTVALLGYLAAEQRPLARDHLMALFWPDWTPSRGRANLRRDLHNLTQILPDCWRLDRQSVIFVPSANTIVDIYQLQQLEEHGRWGEAADLLGGEFLEGLYLEDNPDFENWLLGERERWRGRTKTILKYVIDGHIRRGRYTDALHHAWHLLQLAPWDEETHRQIMRLLAWTGQRGASLRQYESCRQALREELEVEPAPETIMLYKQIHASRLSIPPQLPAFLTEEKARHEFERPPFVGREEELARLDVYMGEALAGQGRVIFITGGPGRGKTALLDAFARREMEIHPDLLVAGGKGNAYAGLGDPYQPYRDVLAMLTGDVEARWDAGSITRDHARRLWDTFPRVVQILLDNGPNLIDVFVQRSALLTRSIAAGQENAPWLPRLQEQVQHNLTEAKMVEQSHLYQQFSNVLGLLTQERPLLLILDDFQWADAASTSLLFHLGRELADANSHLLIACAYRPEEVAVGRNGQRHPLAKVLNEFRRTFGNGWVDLGRTDKGEDRRFIDALLDIEPNRLGERFRAALLDRTNGHPLYTVELLRAMRDRGDLRRDTDGAWIEGLNLNWEMLPSQVEAVIEERIDRLSLELQDILSIASVEGELFTAQVVAAIRNVPERSVLTRLAQDLERRHRLVSEQEEIETAQRRLSRYRFGHILFQEFLYRRLGQGERRHLHGEIAAALEKFHDGQLDELAVQLARHFFLAGNHRRAFHYFTLAGERAALLYESRDAISHYTCAIELADRVSPDVDSLAKLYCGRGLAYERVGEFDKAHKDHTLILQIAQAAGEGQVEWRANLDLGKLWASRDHNQTLDYFQDALLLARRLGDPALLASSLNWMGNWYANGDAPQMAVIYHQEALTIIDDLGKRMDLAKTFDLLGMANLLGGDLSTSVQYHDRAIDLFRELEDLPGLGSSLLGKVTNTSMLVFLASIPAIPAPDAVPDFEEALRIAMEISSVPDEAWAHWTLGLLYTIQGHYGCALKILESGLYIASELGHREWLVCHRFALGILFAESFAPVQAHGQLDDALTLADELNSPHYLHLVRGAIAGACLVNKDLEPAQAYLDEVIFPDTPMDTLSKRYCWTRRAELALAQNEPSLALNITERLIASAPGMSPGRVITYLWKLKADALAGNRNIKEALVLLHEAIDNARAYGERFLLWRLHASLAGLYCTMGQAENAEKEYSMAQSLIDTLAATIPDEMLKNKFRQGACGILGTSPISISG